MTTFRVNKSGSQLPVYNSWNSTDTQVGTLYNNEAFIYVAEPAGSSAIGYDSHEIYFRNSSGSIAAGYVGGLNAYPSRCKGLCNYQTSSKTLGGTSLSVFKLRNAATWYLGTTSKGTLPAGTLIACNGADADSSTHTRLSFRYYSTNSGSSWTLASSTGNAWVNTGIKSTSSMVTKWNILTSIG